jgi:orotidine-5'-phosphate decarboxylase
LSRNLSGADRIIFPLDVSDLAEAGEYVKRLDGHVGLFKIGLELFTARGPEAVRLLKGARAGLFLDLKFHDIPATVQAAVRAAASHGAEFVTVHCDDPRLLQGVIRPAEKRVKVLGVTVLTSLDRKDLSNFGMREDLTAEQVVLLRAREAKRAGCAGVVCSPPEAGAVKREHGKGFIVVTPGVRPEWAAVGSDDQKRTATPYEAIAAGADYLVVGRPIRTAKDPVAAANRIAQEIQKALDEKAQ